MYLVIFILSIFISFLLTSAIKNIALYFNIIDSPNKERKKHGQPIPLLGGIAPFLAFYIILFFLFFIGFLPGTLFKSVVFLFMASLVIMIGGFIDDKYNISAKIQVIFPIIAIIIVVYGGVRVVAVTNPSGGVIELGTAISLILSFLWLFIITYTTKLLDGLDGLVSGIVPLGAFSIFLFTTLTEFKEPSLAYTSLILVGVFIGFLFFNKAPAKIFLGEGGSLFAGFILGSLAILTGAKIAITIMVLALPLIDLAAVILKRLFLKHKSILKGDRMHLHFLLVDRGWKVKNVVYLFWFISALMGIISIFLPSILKVFFLFIAAFIFFVVDIFFFKDV